MSEPKPKYTKALQDWICGEVPESSKEEQANRLDRIIAYHKSMGYPKEVFDRIREIEADFQKTVLLEIENQNHDAA